MPMRPRAFGSVGGLHPKRGPAPLCIGFEVRVKDIVGAACERDGLGDDRNRIRGDRAQGPLSVCRSGRVQLPLQPRIGLVAGSPAVPAELEAAVGDVRVDGLGLRTRKGRERPRHVGDAHFVHLAHDSARDAPSVPADAQRFAALAEFVALQPIQLLLRVQRSVDERAHGARRAVVSHGHVGPPARRNHVVAVKDAPFAVHEEIRLQVARDAHEVAQVLADRVRVRLLELDPCLHSHRVLGAELGVVGHVQVHAAAVEREAVREPAHVPFGALNLAAEAVGRRVPGRLAFAFVQVQQ